MEHAQHPQTALSLRELMTRARWIEIGRIVIVGFLSLLYWLALLPLLVLMAAAALGLARHHGRALRQDWTHSGSLDPHGSGHSRVLEFREAAARSHLNVMQVKTHPQL